MPAVTAGLYSIKLHQVLKGQECLNVFWYRHTLSDNNAAQGLWTAFNGGIQPFIAAATSSDLEYTNMVVQPIFGFGLEVSAVPTVNFGQLSPALSPTCSPFICSSVKLLRASSETRHGWKRFTGLLESAFTGEFLEGPYLAVLEDVANALFVPLGIADELQPVIVRKPGTYGGIPQPGWVYNNIQGAQALNRVTSQNTRKPF